MAQKGSCWETKLMACYTCGKITFAFACVQLVSMWWETYDPLGSNLSISTKTPQDESKTALVSCCFRFLASLTTAHTNHNYNLGDLQSGCRNKFCAVVRKESEREGKDGMMRTDFLKWWGAHSGLILTCHITQVSDVVLGRVHVS